MTFLFWGPKFFWPSAVPEDYHVQDLEINCCFYYGTMLCAYIIWKGTRQTVAASLFRLILELICVCLTHFLIFVQKMIADIWPKLNICSNLMYVLTFLQWRFYTSLKLPSQIVISNWSWNKSFESKITHQGALTKKQLDDREFQFIYICSLLINTIFKEIKWFEIAVFYT